MADHADLIFGNVAYDPFSSAVPELEFPPEDEDLLFPEQPVRPAAPAPRPAARRRGRERVRISSAADTAARAAARVRAGVFAVVAVPLAAACIVALVLLLQAHSRLAAVSNEAAHLEKRIASLEAERARLEIESGSAYNMEEVEKTATTALGMIKADADQAVFLRSTTEDTAVILSAEGGGNPLWRNIREFFRRLGEYFAWG